MMGLVIVGTAFLAGLCISWWARSIATPAVLEPPAPPTTVGIAGFPRAVDAVATLAGAQALTKRTELRGISVWGVRSDGMVDMTAPGHRIRYAFSSARGEGPQPPRAPGTLPIRSFCGRQNVHVRDEGMQADPDQPAASCTGQREPLPNPRCGTKEVWQAAIHRGAPADRVATLEYFRAAAGPAWRFDIPGGTHFTLYGDCERELTGSDAVGSVP